jgi:hypothetical protein
MAVTTPVIEAALEEFKNRSLVDVQAELKELRKVGSAHIGRYAFPAGTSEMEKGYLLGMEVARLKEHQANE